MIHILNPASWRSVGGFPMFMLPPNGSSLPGSRSERSVGKLLDVSVFQYAFIMCSTVHRIDA